MKTTTFACLLLGVLLSRGVACNGAAPSKVGEERPEGYPLMAWGKDEPWKMKYQKEDLAVDFDCWFDELGLEWTDIYYDDSSWGELTGPMGNAMVWYSNYNYVWEGDQNHFLLRRKFVLDRIPSGDCHFSTQHDDGIQVYINGHLVGEEGGWTDYNITTFTVPADVFVEGENLLAVHIEQGFYGAFLDYCLTVPDYPATITDEQGLVYQPAYSSHTATLIGHEGSVPDEITLPITISGLTLTAIASGALADIDNLLYINVQREQPISAASDAFSATAYARAELWVPYGVRTGYTTANGWRRFSKIRSPEAFNRKVVVEESTGTWCGWCPRGIVGLKTMAEQHPDNFIGIAIHSGDEMELADYAEFTKILPYFPMCTINRKYMDDPAADILENYYQLSTLTHSTISVAAQWSNITEDSIAVTTTTRFGRRTHNAYRIAYVVVENQVGPYMQFNAYSGGFYGEMGGFEAEDIYAEVPQDHVARYVSDIYGTAGTLPDAVTCDTAYTTTYAIPMPVNVLEFGNMEIIVLLINADTGEIENADIMPYRDIAEYSEPDQIATTTHATTRAIELYSAGGIRLATPQRGLNIVRMGDGSVRKILR